MRKVLYILGQLSDADVEWMARTGVRRAVAPGQVLITEGQETAELIFVLDGEVSVSVEGIGEVARLGVGEILGEMSLVDNSPPSGTVAATVATQVLALDRTAIAQRLEDDPAFAARFYRAVSIYLSVRLRATMRRLGQTGPDTQDPLTLDMLETVHLAGARFDRMIKRLLGV